MLCPSCPFRVRVTAPSRPLLPRYTLFASTYPFHDDTAKPLLKTYHDHHAEGRRIISCRHILEYRLIERPFDPATVFAAIAAQRPTEPSRHLTIRVHTAQPRPPSWPSHPSRTGPPSSSPFLRRHSDAKTATRSAPRGDPSSRMPRSKPPTAAMAAPGDPTLLGRQPLSAGASPRPWAS